MKSSLEMKERQAMEHEFVLLDEDAPVLSMPQMSLL